MAAKANTLRKDIRQATQDVMAGKHDLPAVKVCTCTQYRPFLAIQLIYRTELAGHSSILSIHVLNTMFVIQVEIEDQPAIKGSVNEQVQDTANVAYQEGLLPEEDIEEERWVLRRNTMAAFNTIFLGYQFINKGFMDLSKLIDGTPLNAMGLILNDIQESAASSAGYAGGGGKWGRGRGSGSGGGEGKKEG